MNGYIGTDRNGLAGGFVGKGEDQIFMEFGRTIKRDHIIPAGVNTMSVGPIIIEDGVTVTVEDDGNWTVV